MKMAISFKHAQESDKRFLLALRKASMSEHLESAGIHLSDEQHMVRINEHYADSYLILLNQQAIGLIKLGVLTESLHIRQLQLLPDFHNKGIGSNILGLVKKKALARNLPITLNVLHQNPAKRLYEREGFYKTGENQLEVQMKWQQA